jgi:membrane peptidoglycan carboxypeptidase
MGNMTVSGGPTDPAPGESDRSHQYGQSGDEPPTRPLRGDEPVTLPLSGSEPPTRPLKTEPGKPSKLKVKPVPPPKPEGPWTQRLRWWISNHKILSAAIALVLVLTGLGGVYVGYLFSSVPTPEELSLPEATTVYYADGSTPMAKLGSENRTLLSYDQMNDAVREAIVAAEDQTFWTNEGIDFKGVLRAAWNNFTGGELQGASTITQQYARVAADLSGVTYSRKLKEAVMAWKLTDKYDKKQILEFYLNTVPFGRGAYGIEAAAQAYLGKTANRNAPAAQQVTMAEAMVLVSMVKQPNPNPDNPDGEPGYDPTRSELALENSKGRWEYVRQGLVATNALTPAEAAALVYPDTVVPWDPAAHTSGLDAPTGLVVSHALSELRQTDQFKNKKNEYIQNGGFRIITTIDPRAQAAAQKAADIRQDGTPAALRGQPANWRAALVAVEPGTGRVLAYYGGENGTGADYAGWYFEEDGTAVGFGQHPPGSSFKVYDLAEALRQNISLESEWDAPASKEFPKSGRVNGSPAGPVRNAASAACQPTCTLIEATVASLNVPFFDLTEHLGTANVIESAEKAGIDSMWANVPGQATPVRTDLRGKSGRDLAPLFSTEVGIGQYGITPLDHANGMATFAAGGKRAQAHFVKVVMKGEDEVYKEPLTQTEIGLDQKQIDMLDYTLHQVPTAHFSDDWDAAGKTGTWQFGKSEIQNAHVWMVGYTRALAAAVWVGTNDGGPLITRTGSPQVFGSTYAGPIWQQFMRDATNAMDFDEGLRKFNAPELTASPSPSPSESPEPSEEPSPSVEPSPEPSVSPSPLPSISPSPLPPVSPSAGPPPPP